MRSNSVLAVMLLAAAGVLSVASPKKSGMPDDPFVSRSATDPPQDRGNVPRQKPPRVSRTLPYPACPAPQGVIQQKQLLKILDRSPGVFLQGVDVTMIPTGQLPGGKHYWKRPKGRSSKVFGGWYIRSFHSEDPCMGRAGLRTGDIIADVNGFTLQHPDDLVRLWKALRTAPRIIVRLYRGGRPLVFVTKIAVAKPKRPAPRPSHR